MRGRRGSLRLEKWKKKKKTKHIKLWIILVPELFSMYAGSLFIMSAPLCEKISGETSGWGEWQPHYCSRLWRSAQTVDKCLNYQPTIHDSNRRCWKGLRQGEVVLSLPFPQTLWISCQVSPIGSTSLATASVINNRVTSQPFRLQRGEARMEGRQGCLLSLPKSYWEKK